MELAQNRNTDNGARCQWLTPIILATWEVRSGGLQFEANPIKWLLRTYLKNTQHKTGLVEWLKW
jgi:hypothetical protein